MCITFSNETSFVALNRPTRMVLDREHPTVVFHAEEVPTIKCHYDEGADISSSIAACHSEMDKAS